MAETLINESRRCFFVRDLKKDFLESEARVSRNNLAARRLQEWECAYETDLLALGPELLIDTARRTEGLQDGADYAKVAKVLAQGFEKASDER